MTSQLCTLIFLGIFLWFFDVLVPFPASSLSHEPLFLLARSLFQQWWRWLVSPQWMSQENCAFLLQIGTGFIICWAWNADPPPLTNTHAHAQSSLHPPLTPWKSWCLLCDFWSEESKQAEGRRRAEATEERNLVSALGDRVGQFHSPHSPPLKTSAGECEPHNEVLFWRDSNQSKLS